MSESDHTVDFAEFGRKHYSVNAECDQRYSYIQPYGYTSGDRAGEEYYREYECGEKKAEHPDYPVICICREHACLADGIDGHYDKIYADRIDESGDENGLRHHEEPHAYNDFEQS